MIRSAGLASVIEDYVLYRSLADSSAYQMDRSARYLEEWLERPAKIADLNDRTISQFLRAIENDRAQRTVANHRTNLLCLWRFAADEKLCSPPHRVRKVSRPDPCPVAWTFDELQLIVTQCGQLEDRFRSGVIRSLYCSTLVKFCYESGLRRSDVWRIKRDMIRPDGSIVLRQKKTSQTHWPRIRIDTLAAIALLPEDLPLACPFKSDGSWYQFWKREVTKPAGVRHGALQQLRRSGATHLAIDHPDAVQRYLGHRTASMQKHYVDQSIARPQQHLPPDIGAA
jgi:integrase